MNSFIDSFLAKSATRHAFLVLALILAPALASPVLAGTMIAGVQLTVNGDDTVTVNNQGSNQFPGAVGNGGLKPYINGWAVSAGQIIWRDTNNTITLTMNSSGVTVNNPGGIANSNGNISGSVTLAPTAVLGAAFRAANGVSGPTAFNSIAAVGSVNFNITGTVTVLAPAGTNPDIAITTTESADPVTAGAGTFTHVVTAANITTNAATGVNVTVAPTLPAGTSLMSANPSGGTYVGTNWNVGNLGANASQTLTLTYSVGASTASGSTVDMAATLASLNETDDDANNNADSESTTVVASADASVTKTDGVSSVNAGASVTYTIVAGNIGPSDLAGGSVVDTFPAALNSCTWTCAATGGSCSAAGAGNINDTVNISVGGSLTYTAMCSIDPSATGSLSNTASVTVPAGTTDTNPNNNSAVDVDTLTASADLSISKSGSPDPVVAGNNLVYTVTVSNAGPSDAAGVAVTDTLPAGVSLVSTTGCAEDPVGVPTCTLGAIPASGSAQYSITVLVDPGTIGTITNSASVTSATSDPNTNNNSISENTTVGAETDLSITKSAAPNPATAGNNLTYTLTVTNNGPSDSSGGTVTDVLPAGLGFVSSANCSEAAGTVTCAVGALGNGANQVLAFIVAVDPAQTASIVNTATVVSNETDPTPANNSANSTTPITISADLSVTKTDGATSVVAGNPLTYTIVASNAGPSDAPGSSVIDAFPAELTCTWTCAGAGGTCTVAGSGDINDTVNLPNGSNVTYTANCDVVAGTVNGAIISNTATVDVAAGTTDPSPGNNSATDDTTVIAGSGVSGTKTVSGSTVPGGAIVYTIVLSNAGPGNQADNPGDEFVDVLPAQITFVSVSADSGIATEAGGVVSWNGAIAAGGTVTINIDATVNSGASGTIVNQGTIFFDSDGSGTNDSSALTDNPAGPGPADPTGFAIARAIPTLGPAGLLLLALGLVAIWYRRERIIRR